MREPCVSVCVCFGNTITISTSHIQNIYNSQSYCCSCCLFIVVIVFYHLSYNSLASIYWSFLFIYLFFLLVFCRVARFSSVIFTSFHSVLSSPIIQYYNFHMIFIYSMSDVVWRVTTSGVCRLCVCIARFRVHTHCELIYNNFVVVAVVRCFSFAVQRAERRVANKIQVYFTIVAFNRSCAYSFYSSICSPALSPSLSLSLPHLKL